MISLLDCTLRDGGLGLEDAKINGIANTSFSKNDYSSLIALLNKTNVDIVELGSIEISSIDKTEFGIYQSIEEISKIVPTFTNPKTMFVALFRGPDTPIEDIPEWNPNLIRGIRVILRYSELEKSLNFCAALSKKGYQVFVQPMLTMRYTNQELDMIIKASNNMMAYACYFVDSYGYMSNKDVEQLFYYYNERLDKSIKIGFHAHNNMNLAYSNALHFIEISNGRDIIVDSCCTGMGQGAGNLQTELISYYLNKHNNQYDYSSILDICDILDHYSPINAWGYSVTRLLPALYKTAYKYSIVFRNKYNLSYSDIASILESMESDKRNRYTAENAVYVLNAWRYKNGNN